jgi:hypothetical protein
MDNFTSGFSVSYTPVNNCKNNAIGGNVTIPISIDNNRNSRSVQSTEHDEYAMADLIAEGTILAVYTDESDSNYNLFASRFITLYVHFI